MIRFVRYGFLILALCFGLLHSVTSFAADITVSTTGTDVLTDDEICTLREAIINANNNAATYDECLQGTDDDTIILQNGITYELSIGGEDTDPSDAGDLDLLDTGTLTITTLDPEGTKATIDATGLSDATAPDRIFDINGPTTVIIENVILANGKLDSLSNSTWTGACIRALDVTSLTLTNSSLIDCTITANDNTIAQGGAIFTTGTDIGLTLSGVTITGAGAERTGLTGTELASGAAIYFSSDASSFAGSVSISDSTISSNTTTNSSGDADAAVTIRTDGEGLTVTIDNSTFDANATTSTTAAANGGALKLTSIDSFTITNTTISNSVLTAATNAFGGGLYFNDFPPTAEGVITNSTISANSALGDDLSKGGGIAGDNFDDGDDDINGDLYLSFVTIADNVSGDILSPAETAQGGGINLTPDTTIINSILADNTVNGTTTDGADCNSTHITSFGNNVITDPIDCTILDDSDIILVSGSLNDGADNGGDTLTQDFDVDYSANDAATETCLDALGVEVTTDQRGAPRTAGTCDSGAYERGTFYDDEDADGFAGTSSTFFYNNAFVTDDDCNDADATVNPDADEVCDSFDNDCDDEIDEASATDASTWYHDADGDTFGDATDSEVACDQPADYVADDTDCNDASAAANPDETEVCDDIDNDCDDEIDEGFSVDEACTVGTGACANTGVFQCADDGTAECSVSAGESSDELCGDEIDNDCDGDTDEGFDVGDACSAGVGACAATGEMECNSDGTDTECNATAGEETTELCGDDIDNDCDGDTDEGFETVGDACTTGVGACETTGVLVCSADGLSTECDAVAGEIVEEVCDDLIDNDCDGDIDADDSDCTGDGGCQLNVQNHDMSGKWLFVATFGMFGLLAGLRYRRRQLG